MQRICIVPEQQRRAERSAAAPHYSLNERTQTGGPTYPTVLCARSLTGSARFQSDRCLVSVFRLCGTVTVKRLSVKMADHWNRGHGAVDDMLDAENKRMAENLASKVSRLKSLAYDIDKDADEQNSYLDGMDSNFLSATGLLTGQWCPGSVGGATADSSASLWTRSKKFISIRHR
ncbi:hypothetical protein SRHO_G00090830 [Serrasalmus rhombeus]